MVSPILAAMTQVGPYVSKRCGDDYEGPDFIFKLQHTPLPDFLGECFHRAHAPSPPQPSSHANPGFFLPPIGLVERLLGISQRMLRSGGTAQTEETLLRPLLDER